jgi:hypothetical protein
MKGVIRVLKNVVLSPNGMKPLLVLLVLTNSLLQTSYAQEANGGPFSCRIKPAQAAYKQGQQVRFAVELWNNTSETQVFATAVDGSEVNWRCPSVGFSVYRLQQNAAKKAMKADLHVRCGNTDAMAPEDFVEVPPGQMMNPCARSRYDQMTDWFNFQHLPPGEYEVVFTYSTVPTGDTTWQSLADGRNEPAQTEKEIRVRSLIARVPSVTLVSNRAHLTITR